MKLNSVKTTSRYIAQIRSTIIISEGKQDQEPSIHQYLWVKREKKSSKIQEIDFKHFSTANLKKYTLHQKPVHDTYVKPK